MCEHEDYVFWGSYMPPFIPGSLVKRVRCTNCGTTGYMTRFDGCELLGWDDGVSSMKVVGLSISNVETDAR